MSALLVSTAGAAGLGKLTVLSALGQPLFAEIELTSVGKDEAASLVPKLASAEAFRQANIDLHPSLLGLRFSIEQKANRQVIRVTSAAAMNEPFVDMLLELTAANGRLVREYTFLLDPAELRNTQSPQVAAAIVLPPAQTVRRDAEPAPAKSPPVAAPVLAQAPTPAPAPAAVAVPVPAPAPAPKQAAAPVPIPVPAPVAKPVPAPLAVQPAKPAAAPETRPVAQQAAAPAPVVQAPVARPAPVPQPAPAPAPAPVAKAAPARPVPVPVAETAAGAQVEVHTGDTLSKIALQNKPEGISLDQMLVALYRANPEVFISKNMNLVRAGQILTLPDAEAAAAVTPAEAHKVVFAQAADFNEYRNKLAAHIANADARPAAESKQGAAGKITAQVAEPAGAATDSRDKLKLSKSMVGTGAEKGVGPAPSTEDKIAKEKALAEANSRVKELEQNVSDMQKILEMKNKDLADRQKQADAAKAKPAAAAEPASASASAQAVAEESKPVAVAKPVAKPVVPATESGMLDNPMVLGGGGLIVALLGGLGFFALRRQRQAKQKAGGASEPSMKHDSVLGADLTEVDPGATEVNSSFAATLAQTEQVEVDPIAEADVYIAYGRDAQAEEILKEALRTNPDRHPVRLKLLEIYANRKDATTFETHAQELFDRTGGLGDEWAQAAALGLTLDATNPLYGNAVSAAAPAPASASAANFGMDTMQSDAELDALLSNTAAEPAPQAAARAADDDDLLMDLDIAMADTASASVVPAIEEPASSNAFDDLDFDLEGLSGDQPFALKPAPVAAAPAPVKPEIVAEAAAAAKPPADFGDINFDFLNDTGMPTAPAVAQAEPASAQAAVPAELEDEFALMEADFANLAAEPAPAKAEAAPAAEAAPLMGDFDLSEISLELNPADSKPAPQPEPAVAASPALSAPVADLQFEEADMADLDAALMEEEGGEEDEADFSENAEMSTKLDLAIAYQEIGDKEGARELLEEVIDGGTLTQVAKARTLLEQLA